MLTEKNGLTGYFAPLHDDNDAATRKEFLPSGLSALKRLVRFYPPRKTSQITQTPRHPKQMRSIRLIRFSPPFLRLYAVAVAVAGIRESPSPKENRVPRNSWWGHVRYFITGGNQNPSVAAFRAAALRA